MEDLFRQLAESVALLIEAIAVVIVTFGALEAASAIAITIVKRPTTHGQRKAAWRRFGTWLLLGLEFELAADIVRSVVSPSWMEIGQLGAIAAIRTFLNYFLEQDLDHAEQTQALADSGQPVARE